MWSISPLKGISVVPKSCMLWLYSTLVFLWIYVTARVVVHCSHTLLSALLPRLGLFIGRRGCRALLPYNDLPSFFFHRLANFGYCFIHGVLLRPSPPVQKNRASWNTRKEKTWSNCVCVCACVCVFLYTWCSSCLSPPDTKQGHG